MDEGRGCRREEASISENFKCNKIVVSKCSSGNTSSNGGATCTMEKTGPNIPTNARPHATSNGSVISGEETVAGAESSVSDQSNNNNTSRVGPTCVVGVRSSGGVACEESGSPAGEKGDCDSSKVDNGESDKETHRHQENIKNSIDLTKESTKGTELTTEGSRRTGASEVGGGGKSELPSGEVKSVSGKPPVPNFRVEGSGAGDSSITVAVASLSSAVSASITLHNSGGRGGSTGGTNSLENGEQPGSSSGPVSIQSSEEMRLSLVSWYSEPDDPSRVIEGCCSVLNTYRQEESESTGQEIITRRDACDSGSSMGHDAISSATNLSPVCKSESEEKENKTPEPCGNRDKGSDIVADKNAANETISKSEFIHPFVESGEKKADSGEKSATLTTNAGDCDSTGQSTLKQNSNRERPEKSHKSLTTPPQKSRAHVQVSEHTQQCGGSSHHGPRCHQDPSNRNSKPECPRCSRRSKSGTTTPATGPQVAKSRTPANRRVVQSVKSSTEIKKPIKSILKHDSRGSAGSGSGSDKQSSMDSLGSSGELGVTPVHILRGRMTNTLMTRSDSGTRARFNFSSGPPDTPSGAPEDKAVSKLKRIEKYATLRVRKSLKPRPLDLSDSEAQPNDTHNSGSKAGVPGMPGEIMSKSMSYLEKASSNRVHISSHGHTYGESNSASSTLKRQGSLRVKKPISPWEPSGTRTSVLRLQKMQEAKAKNSPGGGGGSSGSANSGSAHSGSGDSLHFLPHSANSTSTSAGSSGMSSIHLSGVHSAPAAHGRMSALAAAKEKHMGAKIFSKLSSALGQTASSNQKRVRQERGVQTDVLSTVPVPLDVGGSGRVSLSPVPALEFGPENAEQIKNLERLCNRYRNQFIKVQSEFEKSESRKDELMKQLEETQHESTEMIEFLQAEKSTLAESLTEVEVEVI